MYHITDSWVVHNFFDHIYLVVLRNDWTHINDYSYAIEPAVDTSYYWYATWCVVHIIEIQASAAIVFQKLYYGDYRYYRDCLEAKYLKEMIF